MRNKSKKVRMKCPGTQKIIDECKTCSHYVKHDKKHNCEDWDEHDHGCIPCAEVK
jgi:hypothetical protein